MWTIENKRWDHVTFLRFRCDSGEEVTSLQTAWSPSHWRPDGYLDEYSFGCKSTPDKQIHTQFCICHNICAVMACAKFWSNHSIRPWMKGKRYFHGTRITMQKSIVKGIQGPLDPHHHIHTLGRCYILLWHCTLPPLMHNIHCRWQENRYRYICKSFSLLWHCKQHNVKERKQCWHCDIVCKYNGWRLQEHAWYRGHKKELYISCIAVHLHIKSSRPSDRYMRQ